MLCGRSTIRITRLRLPSAFPLRQSRRKNPYAKQLKTQITSRLDTAVVAYFKQTAAELDMPDLFLHRLGRVALARLLLIPAIRHRDPRKKPPRNH